MKDSFPASRWSRLGATGVNLLPVAAPAFTFLDYVWVAGSSGPANLVIAFALGGFGVAAAFGLLIVNGLLLVRRRQTLGLAYNELVIVEAVNTTRLVIGRLVALLAPLPAGFIVFLFPSASLNTDEQVTFLWAVPLALYVIDWAFILGPSRRTLADRLSGGRVVMRPGSVTPLARRFRFEDFVLVTLPLAPLPILVMGFVPPYTSVLASVVVAVLVVLKRLRGPSDLSRRPDDFSSQLRAAGQRPYDQPQAGLVAGARDSQQGGPVLSQMTHEGFTPASRWARLGATGVNLLPVAAPAFTLIDYFWVAGSTSPTDSILAFALGGFGVAAALVLLIVNGLLLVRRRQTLGLAYNELVIVEAVNTTRLVFGWLVMLLAPLAAGFIVPLVLNLRLNPDQQETFLWAVPVALYVVDWGFILGPSRRTLADRLSGGRVVVRPGSATREVTRFRFEDFLLIALPLAPMLVLFFDFVPPYTSVLASVVVAVLVVLKRVRGPRAPSPVAR